MSIKCLNVINFESLNHCYSFYGSNFKKNALFTYRIEIIYESLCWDHILRVYKATSRGPECHPVPHEI